MQPQRFDAAFMYIVECADRSLYVGSPRNLEWRLEEHQFGVGAEYTKRRLPVRLLYFEEAERMYEAYYREKQVQNWGRAKRVVLVKGELDTLTDLSRKRRRTAE